MNFKSPQVYLGIGVFVIAIVAFVWVMVANLPSSSEVNQQAQAIPAIPADLFSTSNPLVSKMSTLTTPNGVPVVVNPNNIGRTNVFQSY